VPVGSPQDSGKINQSQVICDCERPKVEKYMVVRTQAQHVFAHIGSTVRTPERADMSPFCIWTTRCGERFAADLATELAEFFHRLDDSGAADDALNCREPPNWFCRDYLAYGGGRKG
jgi:hypothetical protein